MFNIKVFTCKNILSAETDPSSFMVYILTMQLLNNTLINLSKFSPYTLLLTYQSKAPQNFRTKFLVPINLISPWTGPFRPDPSANIDLEHREGYRVEIPQN